MKPSIKQVDARDLTLDVRKPKNAHIHQKYVEAEDILMLDTGHLGEHWKQGED